MKVILLESVHNLGKKGAIIEVSEGYARNYLVPKKLALSAGEPGAKKLSLTLAAQINRQVKKQKDQSRSLRRLEGKKFSFNRPSSPAGHLYSAVTGKNLAEKIKSELDMEIDFHNLEIDKAIKTIGEHLVGYRWGKDNCKFIVAVTSDEKK